MHPEVQFLEPLSTEPSDWPQLLFIYVLVIWIFKEVEKIVYFLWTMNYVLLSGHWVLKERVVSMDNISKRHCWEKAKFK